MTGSLLKDFSKLRGVAVAALLAVPVGCGVQTTGGGPPDATPTGEMAPPATVTTPPEMPPAPTGTAQQGTETAAPAAAEDRTVVGTWRSASCGERKYERVITFNADGSFAAQDRVSPCPPGVQCVWSGIVNRRGEYARSGDALTLRVVGQQPTQGKPFPEKMVIDAASKAPAEEADGAMCVYAREGEKGGK
ncbi:MAG TPA: hypothetical protein VLS89_18600 [Candidatus Nanopelagicales bacterium]|nr:hypothetical protein [Candidatus Nanopelagicales bacterium]